MEIVSIVGTKGKTTVARLVDHLLDGLVENRLRVDSDGVWLNGDRQMTSQESKELYGLIPSVCPGKHLGELRGKDKAIAVLENSIGSERLSGVGYWTHGVGVLTNVYEDHLSKLRPRREDLAEAKGRLCFKKLAKGGVVVVNMDDKLVCEQLDKYKKKVGGLIRVSLEGSAGVGEADVAIFYDKEDGVVRVRADEIDWSLAVDEIEWTFGGEYKPSVLNLMLAVGVVVGLCAGLDEASLMTRLKEFEFGEDLGRLVVLTSDDGARKVILDYAHEKYSLGEISKLARSMSKGKVVGLVRFSPDRNREQIGDYAQALAGMFDEIVVFDKVGDAGDVKRLRGYEYGEVPRLVVEALGAKFPEQKVRQENKEEEAVKLAAGLLEDGDVVVYISNDHEVSLGLAKRYLMAI